MPWREIVFSDMTFGLVVIVIVAALFTFAVAAGVWAIKAVCC